MAIEYMYDAGGSNRPSWRAQQARKFFGVQMDAEDVVYDYYSIDESHQEGQAFFSEPHGDWFRATVIAGEADFDAPTSERSEISTLGTVEPAISGDPRLGCSFDFFIPENHYHPAGTASIVFCQFKVTSVDAFQILYNPNGYIRLRYYNGTSTPQLNVLHISDVRGTWVHVEVYAKWSLTAAGQLRVIMDGVTKLNQENTINIAGSPSGAQKVYSKFGVYRATATTDADRQMANIFFKNITLLQDAAAWPF